MSARAYRAYILLNIIEDKTSQIVRILRSKAGVGMIDVLDGSPNVIMMVEAHDRQRLAELTVAALASVENMTEDLKLLPVRRQAQNKRR